LNLGFDVVDRIRRLDFQGDRLSGQRLHEDLHSSSQSQDKVQSGLLLDVVIGESSAVFELLSGENESLLVGRDTFPKED
jgi:hypothetical protein